jgi:hypothetical protein
MNDVKSKAYALNKARKSAGLTVVSDKNIERVEAIVEGEGGRHLPTNQQMNTLLSHIVDDASLALAINQGINATKSKEDGSPDYFARAKYIEMILKVKGYLKEKETNTTNIFSLTTLRDLRTVYTIPTTDNDTRPTTERE